MLHSPKDSVGLYGNQLAYTVCLHQRRRAIDRCCWSKRPRALQHRVRTLENVSRPRPGASFRRSRRIGVVPPRVDRGRRGQPFTSGEPSHPLASSAASHSPAYSVGPALFARSRLIQHERLTSRDVPSVCHLAVANRQQFAGLHGGQHVVPLLDRSH